MKTATGGVVLLGLALVAATGLWHAPAAIGMPDLVLIPIVKEHGKSDPPVPGRFVHSQHSQYECFHCHPSAFPYARQGFTHRDMDAGRYCGRCHNGVTAWGIRERQIDCETCHVEEEEEDDDE